MAELTEGMTPSQFLTALNDAFLDKVANYVVITDKMDGVALVSAINGNFSDTIIAVGNSANSFFNGINNAFDSHDISLTKPTDLALNWIDDYCRITFTDNTSGAAQHEIWESKDGGDYELIQTLDTGVETYDYYTWQNASLNFKIRAKNGSLYSAFTDVENIVTPLVAKVDQSTLEQVVFRLFTVAAGNEIVIHWGDDETTTVNTEHSNAITHDYSETADPYFISLVGDVDALKVWAWEVTWQGYGDVTKWNLPSQMVMLHHIQTRLSGSIENWFPLPEGMNVLNIEQGGEITGDLSEVEWNDTQYIIEFHNQQLTGNPIANGIPDVTKHLRLSNNNFEADFTDLTLPSSIYFVQLANNGALGSNNFYGSLSGQSLPESDGAEDVEVYCRNLSFTTGYRGHFKWVGLYDFYNNLFSSSEIDSLLAYIDDYFTDGVVPLTDCEYYFDGASMGTPSAAGLASKTSIEGKYTSAGFTATISVNS